MGGVDKLNELAAIMEKARQECAEKGKAAFEVACADVFAAHPGLQAFSWKQYTPYFNDGEPCEFSVGDLASIRFGNEAPKTSDDDEDYEEEDDLWFQTSAGKWYDSDDWPKGKAEAATACSEIVEALQSMEDMAELAFGDHVCVTVSRGPDGKPVVEADDYHHD